MTTRRAVGLTGTLAVIAALLAPLASGPAHAVQAPPAIPEWAQPQASVTASPTSILGASRSAKGARVVAVFARGGRPVIRAWNLPTRAAALAKIAAVQANPTAISVATEQRQQFLEPRRATRSGDPMRSQQWALSRLQADVAWTRSQGAGVTVAVVDTGIAVHADLQGTIVPGVDVTGSGDGRNDGHGHGTHVAGIIAATADNSIGIAGLAPAARLMPVKVLSDSGSGYSSWVASGIRWAADNGADIISMSLGGGYDAAEAIAVDYAISRGVTVIAAAGNERAKGSPVSYPAAFPGVIAVAATNSDDTIASYSNRGSYISIAAPGSAILSTIPTDAYASWSGTSMATPYVSATAALLLSRARALGVTVSITNALTGTADDLGPAGVDPDFGAGLVDPVAALAALGDGSTTLNPPTEVRAVAASSSRIVVTWSEPTDATGVRSYAVSATPGNSTCSVPVGQSSCALTGLATATAYTISVRSIGITSSSVAATASTTTLPRQDLAGDSMAAATPMPSSQVDELIDLPGDIDWWSTVVPSDGLLGVTLGNLPADYDLRVYNAAGALVGSSLNGNTTSDSTSITVSAGTYYVQVSPYNSAYSESQPYRLSTEFTPTTPPPPPPPAPLPDDLAGDTMGTSTLLGPGVTREYLLADDHDYWSFSLDRTTDVTIQLAELPADFDISLISGDGSILQSSQRAWTTPEWMSARLPAGTYYVHIWGYQGAYSNDQQYALDLALADVEVPDLAGDTLETATPLVGLVGDDLVNDADDVDFWYFQVIELSRADVDLTKIAAAYGLTLLRADGTVVGASNRARNADERVSAWLQPGTYFVRVASAMHRFSEIPYHLEVALTPLGRATLDQAGSTLSTASALPAEGVDEILHAGSDVDVWSFTVTTTSRVNATLTNLSANYQLVLLDRNGRPLSRSAQDGLASESVSMTLRAGTYYLRVVSHRGVWSVDDYRLSMWSTRASVARSAMAPRGATLTDTTLSATTIKATDELGPAVMSVKFSAAAGQTRLVTGQLVAANATARIFVSISITCTGPGVTDLDGVGGGRNVWPGLGPMPIYGALMVSITKTGTWTCELAPFVCTPPQCDLGPDAGAVSLIEGSAQRSSYLSVSQPLAAGSSSKGSPSGSSAALTGGAILVQPGQTGTTQITFKTAPVVPFTLEMIQATTNCIVPTSPDNCASAKRIDDHSSATVSLSLTVTQKAKGSAVCTVVKATPQQGARSLTVSWQQHHAQARVVMRNIQMSTAPGCQPAFTVTLVGTVKAGGNAMTLERGQTPSLDTGYVLAYA